MNRGETSDVRREVYRTYVSDKMSYERAFRVKDYERWARNTYRQLRGWLPQDLEARILDAACGHGNVMFMLRANGYRHVEGVDVSEEQLALARHVVGPVYSSDVMVFLSERMGVYDAVMAFDLIEHFTKREVLDFLRHVRDSLRPGGQIIIQTPNAASPFGCGLRYGDFTHEIGFDPASLAHVLRLSGFVDVRFRETGPTIHGPRSMVRWLLWRCIRTLLQVWNLAETGGRQSVLTRVFRARATRA